MRRDSRVKAIAVCAVILFAIVLAAIKFLPKELQREADRIGMRETLNRVSGKTARGTTLGFAVWRDNILFGCGGNGQCYADLHPVQLRSDEVDDLRRRGNRDPCGPEALSARQQPEWTEFI